MKKRNLCILLIGGATIVALSFLLGSFENETVQLVRWAVFAFGLILAVAGTALLALACARKEKRKLLPEGAEYRAKRAVMTQPEAELYRRLNAILGARFTVLPQVSLSAIVDKVSGGGFRTELFRVVDFCVTDTRNYQPLLIIELNDASHGREERKLRDEKVSAICEDAGIPLLALTLDEAKDERRLRSELRRVLR